MAYIARTKDNAGEVGRSADQQASVDNDVFFKSSMEGGSPGSVIRRVVTKTGIVDNVATEIFTITTVDEAGPLDGGAYAVKMHGVVAHNAAATAQWSAVKGFGAQFARAMERGGTGVNSVVLENLETASAPTSAANRDIGTVTLTLVETSEFINSVRIQIDLTGTDVGTADVSFVIELAWIGFLTPPVIA